MLFAIWIEHILLGGKFMDDLLALMKTRIITLFIAIAFFMSTFSLSVSAQTPLKGIALGDSVAAYFGVQEKDGYVAKLSALLQMQNINNDFTNLAVNGLNTQTLLEQLAKNDVLSEIKNADIITLNIGGNNVLTPFIEMLFNDLETLINNTAQPSPDLLMEFFDKKMTEQQMAALMGGITVFQKDLPEIINILHTEAPNAEIFVNTVYNPITPEIGVYASSEILIPLINKIIIDSAEELGYIVVDIYSIYKKSSDNITNFNLTADSIDIHPNAAGHTLIAEATVTKILENIEAKTAMEIQSDDIIHPNEESHVLAAETTTAVVLNDIEIDIDIEIETAMETQTNDNIVQANIYVPPTGDILPFTSLFIFIAAAMTFAFTRKNRRNIP